MVPTAGEKQVPSHSVLKQSGMRLSKKENDMPSEENRQYRKIIDEFQLFLREEITICHHILSQMSQQEYLMLIGEMDICSQLEEEVKQLKKEFKNAKGKRQSLEKKFIETLSSITSFLDLLDPLNEDDAETLILLEKSEVLVKKIEDQKKRNKTLYEMIEKEGSLDPNNRSLRSEMIYDSKSRKPLLITIDFPDETPPL
jgi:seryl-tRNA synthetase